MPFVGGRGAGKTPAGDRYSAVLVFEDGFWTLLIGGGKHSGAAATRIGRESGWTRLDAREELRVGWGMGDSVRNPGSKHTAVMIRAFHGAQISCKSRTPTTGIKRLS